MRKLMCVMAAVCAIASSGLAAEAPPPVGFEAMERLELLPCFFPPGTQTRHVGNYDMSGGNDAGWKHWIRGLHTNGDWIVFDDVGPGCLYRQQMNIWHRTGGAAQKPAPASDSGARIRYWFDDEERPRLDTTFDGFFGKDQKYTAPFTPPLVFFDDRESKDCFANSYYPFPFKKRLMITMTPQPLTGNKWFQYTYLKYPAGAPVETWKGSDADSPLTRERWNKAGEDPKDASGNKPIERKLDGLAPGARETLLELNEPGSITSVRIAFAPVSADAAGKTRLVMTWDGESKPAVDVSLGAFVGVSALDFRENGNDWKKTYRALMQGYDGKAGSLYSYWPMPFWSKARIEAVNEGPKPLSSLTFRATWKPMSALNYPRDSAGHFHVLVKRDESSAAACYSTLASVAGRGRIVGQFMHTSGFHMDGDEFSYFDGSLTPQIHGSGSEDEHNQGWGGRSYDKPLWGGLHNGFMGGYRFYLNESYLFDRKCLMTYEHFDMRAQRSEGVIYAYLDPAGRAFRRLTDALDVGDAASEAEHAFAITGETWTGAASSCYDLYIHDGKHLDTRDDGRAFTGEIRFQAAIGKDNRGVVLRRRADRRQANLQVAEVLVDGASVPQLWHFRELPAPAKTAWCDSEFAIPASFTMGKERVALRICCRASDHPALWEKPVADLLPVRFDARKDKPARGINAFQIWVFTLGPTAIEEPPAAPNGLAATATGTDGMRLDWSGSDDNIEFYTVERCAVNEAAFTEAAKPNAGQTWAMVSGLAGGMFYEFRVRAHNRFGAGAPAKVLVQTPYGDPASNPIARAKASASSTWESAWGGSAAAANDGKMDTRWNSAKDQAKDQWLAFELAEPGRLCAVLIYQETQWTRISKYRIQVWEKEAWKDVYQGADMEDVALCRFAQVNTAKIRICIDETTGNTPTIKEVLSFTVVKEAGK